MADWLERERRAYALLQWVPYSVPSEFDEELAAAGYYSQLQFKRSSEALDAWDKEHPRAPSADLEAFDQLHKSGFFSRTDFYSPAKAKRGFYTKRLKGLTAELDGQRSGQRNPSESGRASRRYRNRRRGDRRV